MDGVKILSVGLGRVLTTLCGSHRRENTFRALARRNSTKPFAGDTCSTPFLARASTASFLLTGKSKERSLWQQRELKFALGLLPLLVTRLVCQALARWLLCLYPRRPIFLLGVSKGC